MAWEWTRQVLRKARVPTDWYAQDRPGVFFAYGTGPDNASYHTDPENEERALDYVRVVSVLRGAYMEAHRWVAAEMREHQEKETTGRHDDNDKSGSQVTSRQRLDNDSEDNRDEDTSQQEASDDETDYDEDENETRDVTKHKPVTEETETWTAPDTMLARRMRWLLRREITLDLFATSGDFERSYGFATAPRSYRTETEDEFNRTWGRLVLNYDTTNLSFDDNDIPRVYARTQPRTAAAEI